MLFFFKKVGLLVTQRQAFIALVPGDKRGDGMEVDEDDNNDKKLVDSLG